MIYSFIPFHTSCKRIISGKFNHSFDLYDDFYIGFLTYETVCQVATSMIHIRRGSFLFPCFFPVSFRTEYIITSSATCLKSHHVWQHIEMYYNFCFIAIKNRLSCFQLLLHYKNNTFLLFLFVNARFKMLLRQ